MSYVPLEWVRPMMSERWGRLIEENIEGGSGAEWKHNNRPRELAREYLQLSEWAQHLERELISSNKALSELGHKLADVNAKSLTDQVAKNERVLSQTVSSEEANGA